MPEKRSWIVKLRCVVDKEIVTSDCTEEEANDRPYDYVEDEYELGQEDFEVVSVRAND